MTPGGAQAEQIEGTLAQLDKKIEAAVKNDSEMQRLCSSPRIGPLTAYAIVAAIGDGRQFNTARDFAAWVGLTPKENSSANARRQSGILARRPVKVSVVAQAAKNARIAWVVLTSGQAYRRPGDPMTSAARPRVGTWPQVQWSGGWDRLKARCAQGLDPIPAARQSITVWSKHSFDLTVQTKSQS